MNSIKHCFLKILQNNITYDSKVVPVVIKDYWVDKTPCINIFGRPYRVKRYRQHRTEYFPLKETHPLYDPTKPNEKYPTLVEYNKFGFKILLSIWCNNEEERVSITEQVNDILFRCKNNNYLFCTNFNKTNNKCSTSNTTCTALTDTGYHGLRGQCTKVKENNFCNILDKYGIIKKTIEEYPDYEDDDYSVYPPLKHTIKEIDMKYYDKRILCSNPSLSYSIDFE